MTYQTNSHRRRRLLSAAEELLDELARRRARAQKTRFPWLRELLTSTLIPPLEKKLRRMGIVNP